MREREHDNRPGSGAISRRVWIAGTLAAGLAGPKLTRGDDPPAAAAEEAKEEQAVKELGRSLGLNPFRTSRSDHYLGIGDSTSTFLALNLRDLEGLAADYFVHYRRKGFEIAMPGRRLTVVILVDDRAFMAYVTRKNLREIPRNTGATLLHGVYERKTNRLALFDHRSLGPQFSPRARFDNIQTVSHEGTHQLTFNTGLLRRDGDVPRCIVEGLAMYGEDRPFDVRSEPGRLSHVRLRDLIASQRQKISWIPLDRLLAEDGLKVPLLLFYAQSWLLVDYLMKESTRLPAFRAYLEAIRGRNDKKSRLEDAKTHLGDLGRLDEELHAYYRRLARI